MDGGALEEWMEVGAARVSGPWRPNCTRTGAEAKVKAEAASRAHAAAHSLRAQCSELSALLHSGPTVRATPTAVRVASTYGYGTATDSGQHAHAPRSWTVHGLFLRLAQTGSLINI